MNKTKAFSLLQLVLGITLGFLTRYLPTRVVLVMFIMFLLLMDVAIKKVYEKDHRKEWFTNVFWLLTLSFLSSWVIFLNI